MKKSKMVLKMCRYYVSQHVMYTSGYITLDQFMYDLLKMQEGNGVLPPEADDFNIGNNWEPEEPTVENLNKVIDS